MDLIDPKIYRISGKFQPVIFSKANSFVMITLDKMLVNKDSFLVSIFPLMYLIKEDKGYTPPVFYTKKKFF